MCSTDQLRANLVVGLLAGSLSLAQAGAQAATPAPTNSSQTAAAQPAAAQPAQGGAAPTKSAGTPSRYLPGRFGGRAGMYYRLVWGIDSLKVKWAESGEIIRLSWRVLDPDKAKALNDERAAPSLIDPQAGVSLVIPVMEKVGQLRQTASPETGKSYWMAFSNRGRMVKRGDRVDVVIGQFRAEGLGVE